MSEIADRYRNVAAVFTARVAGVPEDGWERPTPCEGWVARDIIRHLVAWVPGMVWGGAGLPAPAMPSVDDDPAAAWAALDGAVQDALDDPATAGRTYQGQMGEQTLAGAIGTFVLGDVLVHTWDLARATGQDEALDPAEVHELFVGMEPMEDALRQSGHFGPRVTVPDDADEQTKLLAFSGRTP